jgi:hypothetical protein
MHGITEQEVRNLQRLNQNDKVRIRINTEYGPY